jgi:osmoprotectant transport system substrate-binding protein
MTALVCVGVLLWVGCDRSDPGTIDTSALDDDAITVGSFNFSESVLLAELYAQALEGHGYRVERQLDLGPRELVMPALVRGLVELVPEYAGSALAFFGGSPGSGEAETHDHLGTVLADRGIVALAPSPAEDQNGFVVTRATADRYGLRALSDLGPHAHLMALGGPTECLVRPLCLGGLQRVYGLRFADFLPLDTGGPLTLDAILRGTVDVGLMFTTDGSIERRGLVLLSDDRGLQPAENVVPVLRAEVLERLGAAVEDILDAVSAALTTRTLRGLNAAVQDGQSPRDVARQWLDDQGLRSG